MGFMVGIRESMSGKFKLGLIDIKHIDEHEL